MNFYSVRHLTRFRYSRPISESIMEKMCIRDSRIPAEILIRPVRIRRKKKAA